MSLEFWLYMVDILSNLSIVFSFFSFICLIICICAVFSVKNNDKEEVIKYNKIFCRSLIWMVCLLSINIFIPGQKTMYLMLGTTYLKDSALPAKVSEILSIKLDDVLKELKEENKS